MGIYFGGEVQITVGDVFGEELSNLYEEDKTLNQ